MMKLRNHIERAVHICGSQAKLAAAVGCTQQHISYLLRSDSVSAETAIKIDRATGGEVSVGHLRPDLFPTNTTSDASQGQLGEGS